MLRTYSSRIVRSVGCAALTLFLAATTCPTFGASTVRTVESLSTAERASLPNTTLIKLKTGRPVALGVLRSEHKRRLQRFANAAMLGKRASLLLTHEGGAANMGSQFKKKKTTGGAGTLVPMKFSQLGDVPFGPVPRPASSGSLGILQSRGCHGLPVPPERAYALPRCRLGLGYGPFHHRPEDVHIARRQPGGRRLRVLLSDRVRPEI